MNSEYKSINVFKVRQTVVPKRRFEREKSIYNFR